MFVISAFAFQDKQKKKTTPFLRLPLPTGQTFFAFCAVSFFYFFHFNSVSYRYFPALCSFFLYSFVIILRDVTNNTNQIYVIRVMHAALCEMFLSNSWMVFALLCFDWSFATYLSLMMMLLLLLLAGTHLKQTQKMGKNWWFGKITNFDLWRHSIKMHASVFLYMNKM